MVGEKKLNQWLEEIKKRWEKAPDFKVPQENNISFCFSNMYAGKKYSKDRLCDLKELNYSKKDINNCIREKIGVYEWESDWSIRKDGKLQSKLKIRKFGTDDYINLAL